MPPSPSSTASAGRHNLGSGGGGDGAEVRLMDADGRHRLQPAMEHGVRHGVRAALCKVRLKVLLSGYMCVCVYVCVCPSNSFSFVKITWCWGDPMSFQLWYSYPMSWRLHNNFQKQLQRLRPWDCNVF